MVYHSRTAAFVVLAVVFGSAAASDLAAQDESITIAREHLALL